MGTADDDDVLRSAGYLLIKAGHYIGMEFDAALTSLGLSGREFLLLSFVRSASGLSQQELSARLALDMWREAQGAGRHQTLHTLHEARAS